MFQKEVVIDCRGHLVGRLASIVAKELLAGQRVVCVRCEELNICGGSMCSPSSRSARLEHPLHNARSSRHSISLPLFPAVLWSLCLSSDEKQSPLRCLHEKAHEHQPLQALLPLPCSFQDLLPCHPWYDSPQDPPRWYCSLSSWGTSLPPPPSRRFTRAFPLPTIRSSAWLFPRLLPAFVFGMCFSVPAMGRSPDRKYIRLGDLSSAFGWKYDGIIKVCLPSSAPILPRSSRTRERLALLSTTRLRRLLPRTNWSNDRHTMITFFVLFWNHFLFCSHTPPHSFQSSWD